MGKPWIAVAALGAGLLVSTWAAAEQGTRLFKDWHYGQHIDQFPRSQGYYDCSDDLGAWALCHDGVAFLERQFQGQLFFADDGTLVSAALLADYSDDLYASVVGALVRNFALVYAEGPAGTFDMVQHIHEGTFSDERSLQLALSEFETEQLRHGYIGMTMVDQAGLGRIRESASVEELLLDLSPGVRASDVYVYEDDYWGPTLETTFYLPARQLNRFQEKAEQAPVEDF